ncbi:MAG: rhomboid family intramembrane serine protease [Candidatus Eisenbacteria bacterium]|nr:rhomboid family intramembrane serine protease [Candidatus Eisenbacteria bacterium]
MTTIRIQEESLELPDHDWPNWVRAGRVPPDALVLSAFWTRGVWRRAESIESYHLFLPARQPVAPLGQPQPERHGPFRLFRGRALALTEVLVAVNLLVTATLLAAWYGSYSDHLWGFAATLRTWFESGILPVLFIPLFLHATPMHILSNMVALIGSGAVVEEFYGRRRMLVLYLGAGIAGAVLSYFRDKPVLSVGASGAIFGLYGVATVFLLRYFRRFPKQLRWKTTRVYLPFLVLIVAPSIWQADLLSHLGGYLGGALLALFIRPLEDRIPSLPEPESPAEPEVVLGPPR